MGKAPALIVSHWYHLFEGLQASPKEFYASVDKAIAARKLPDAKALRVDWHEGGPLSPKREYLRVIRKEHVFDICGAPFGNGFFVSWWLGEMPSGCLALLSLIPGVGIVAEWLFSRATYYRIDTALMFQESIRKALEEVLDGMTNAKGIRALTELERKPILKGFIGK